MKSKYKNSRLEKLNLSLTDRILIIAVITLTILGMTTLNIYINSSKRNQFELIEMEMEQTAKNQEVQFESFVQEKMELLIALSTYVESYEVSEAAKKEFVIGEADGLGFEHLFVVDNNGMGYYFDEGVYRNQSDEVFFQNIMANEVYITEPFYTGNGLSFVTECVAIYNKDEKRVGTLCGAVNLDSIQRLIERNAMILNGDCFIVNEEGKYMTSADSTKVYYQESVYDIPNSNFTLLEKAFNEQSDQKGKMIIDGIEYQVYLSYFENFNWVAVRSIPIIEIAGRYEFINRLHGVLIILVGALIFCMVRIVHNWKQSNDIIYTDALTNCYSRAACARMIDQLENVYDCDITIIYMDLNKFKFVNDTYGHDKGDQLLIVFAQCLMKTFGEVGFVGRMGGDEFVCFLENVDGDIIREMWAKLEIELAKQSELLDFPYTIESSYGYAVRKKNERKPLHQLMQEADERMYNQKHGKE